MFRLLRRRQLGAFLLLASATAPAHATPSTVFWAPSTPALQADRVLHLTYDTYFASDAAYPVDVGLTMGVFPWKGLQLELGVDVLYPTVAADGALDAPVYFNGKLGAPEDVYFAWQPAWSFGIYNAAVESDVTDYNILDGVIGKTVPVVGALSVGGYYGPNDDLMVDQGEGAQAGLLAGWFSQPIDVPLIERIHFAADVQTGKNSLGAAGGGVYVYFTPAIDLLTGPVFFFEPDLQPGGNRWMWSVQLDVDVDFKPGGPPPVGAP